MKFEKLIDNLQKKMVWKYLIFTNGRIIMQKMEDHCFLLLIIYSVDGFNLLMDAMFSRNISIFIEI